MLPDAPFPFIFNMPRGKPIVLYEITGRTPTCDIQTRLQGLAKVYFSRDHFKAIMRTTERVRLRDGSFAYSAVVRSLGKPAQRAPRPRGQQR